MQLFVYLFRKQNFGGTSMKSHINTLKQKHTQLDLSIKSANDNHLSDITINTLKKQKLLLKEKILKLEKQN
jgi:hypothetical protein